MTYRHTQVGYWMFVVSAVELQLRNGTRFRIGTDEPQAQLAALQRSGVPA